MNPENKNEKENQQPQTIIEAIANNLQNAQEKSEIVVETEDGNNIFLKMKEIYDTITTIEEQKAQLELKRAEMKYLYQHYCAQGKRELFLKTKEQYFEEHHLDSHREDMTFSKKRK